jgi:anti-sigma factor RsiW
MPHDHARITDLAATAIDFELTPDETDELERGLEACPACRRRAVSMRATAGRLGQRAPLDTPERVRSVVLRGAAGGRRQPARSFGLLLAATLTVGVLLAGGVLLVGAPGPTPSVPTLPSTAVVPTGAPTTSEPPSSSVAQTPSPTAPTLGAGATAVVVATTRLVVRSAPGRGSDSAELPSRLYPGQRAVVLRGPVAASGYDWLQLRSGSIEGWVATASRAGEPWLAALDNGAIATIGSDGDGSSTLRVIDLDGRLLWELAAPELTGIDQLAWSPDGSWLAFVARPDAATPPEVYAVRADGSDLRRLTSDQVENDSLAWAPDSARLVVHRRGEPGGLVVVDLEGATGPVIADGVGGAWSRDAGRIAYSSPIARGYELWLVNPDGSDGRRVSSLRIPGQTPAFSPDSQQLAVLAGSGTDGCAGICLIDRPTGSANDIGDGSGVPSWSPRGRQVLTVDRGAGGLLVTVLSIDGGAPLTLPAPDRSTVDDVLAPAWSPDGRSILATVLVDGAWRLAVAAADGSGTVLIDAAPGTIAAMGAAWQPVPLVGGSP